MLSRKAIIDIGTNSIKFCLAEGSGAGGYKVIKDVNDIARLGEGLKDAGRIGAEALERNARSVANFVGEAKAAGADEIVAVGTMALRVAGNAADFIARVKELCGVELRVLSGEEEAQLSYVAVMSGIEGAAEADLMTMDTGGGSTEFVFGKAGKIVRKFSLNVGAVRFTEQYLAAVPVAANRLAEAQAAIKKELADGGVTGPVAFLVGMGGTVTSMASVKHKMPQYDPDVIHGSTLSLDDVKAQIADYAAKTLEQRREIVGLQPKRADVILAGACIVKAVLELTGAREMTVSDRSLRHGLLFQLFKA
ncbi:Ppx/GppA phosphatase family protein [Pyramidobacter piscolens W5455]|mgnify:FL=1|uniref:Ppx/GppA phosphatase family protein n=1 Tax=Pyramidobacter piscolens W5455 TaxID=352165 RepID=A0ABM9ZRR9_9BACT|nr:Ppx/GppA phosphatase family protein [Pyramidobacter piscolens]EFB89515.1 Ppx/GppA phosphatase family protein [Pyramidobacter piscolens W5455]